MGKNIENGTASKTYSSEPEPAPLLFSCRLTLFLVCMITTFSFTIQRVNINFALVCMVKPIHHHVPPLNSTYDISSLQDEMNSNNSVLKGDFETLENITNYENILDLLATEQDCKFTTTLSKNNSNPHGDVGEFEWSKDVQGALLASFYYGFMFTQIPGGWICDRFGAKKALVVTAGLFSFLSLVNPVAARLGPWYLFVTRLLQGLVNGGASPCINVLASRWCGAGERAFLHGIASAGFSIASAVTYPIAAFLCSYLGWDWIFYVTGTFGIICCIGSHFLLYEWPEQHPRIQITELQYLRKARAVQYGNGNKTKLNVPWKQIIFSRPIIALVITNFCCYWVYLTIATYLPSFLKEVMAMDISQNGMYSSIPFIVMMFFHFSVSHIFDLIRKMDLFQLTVLRKIFNTIGMVIPAICLSVIGFLSCNSQIEAICVIALGLAFTEFAFMGGYNLSIFEIAPRFTGVVTGISYTSGLLTGFLCPPLVGYITATGSRSEWLMVFYITAALSTFGSIVYLLLGSSELQSWAAPPAESPRDTELKALQENLLDKSIVKAGRG